MFAFPAGVTVWGARRVIDMCTARGLLEPLAQPLAPMKILAQPVPAKGLAATRTAVRYPAVPVAKAIKILWQDGVGQSLYRLRLEAGKFI